MPNTPGSSTVRIGPETLELLKRERERIGVPFAQIVKRAVREYLKAKSEIGICIDCGIPFGDNPDCDNCSSKEGQDHGLSF